MDPRIPCKKNCEKRSSAYCQVCPEWLAYKELKEKEYEEKKKEFDFRLYDFDQYNKRAKRSIRFKNGSLR